MFTVLRLAVVLALLVSLRAAASDYAMPRFTDPDRAQRVRALLPEVDKLFTDLATTRHMPGLVWAIMLDGEVVHTGAHGYADIEKKIAASPVDTRFRIASMTKSFTALAILKLRDAGKLTLDDAVTKHIPDFARVTPLTADAPPVTLRHLLAMAGGFPEDNPWGDRQLAVTDEQLLAFLRGGVALSTTAGTTFEYSNLGYALLGRIVTRVAGEPYQRYIAREIFAPLGMKDTVWDYTEVPAGKLALGYRRENNQWSPEPLLHDGAYGAMGGLLTTIPDFARYVALHLAAYPARDDPERGPVRRATLREMHQPLIVFALTPNDKTLAGDTYARAHGYGFGLGWTRDSRRFTSHGHSGGLPGFGSNYVFYPGHGFAVISFANLTYAGTSATNAKVAQLLLEKAGLPTRTLPVAPLLAQRQAQVVELLRNDWPAAVADPLVAENFFLDRSRDAWRTLTKDTLAKSGAIRSVGELIPENQLRGTFPLVTENGRIDVYFTLTPEATPKLQQLRLTFVAQP
ncbi:MAG TPA: serine hydrolase domain-containing protein [Opitutaceae bacterium]